MQTSTNGRVYEFGAYRLDTASQLLYCAADGRSIPLTARVYDTLLFLVEHPGELLDKGRLMQAIWPNVVVEENNLDQNISTLRQLLGERRGENRFIVTVRGRGYRFVAPVMVVAPPPKEPSIAEAPLALADAAVGRTYDAPRRRRPGRVIAIAAAALLAVIAAGIALWPDRSPQPAARSGPELAVLPFRPLATTDRSESLELGMAETLIAGLHGAGLAVRPLSAVRRFGGVEQDAVLAGKALDVTAVLEGYIQRDGDRLRVSARLLDVADGRQLWAGRYDEPFTDIFSVQDAIASRVRAALRPELIAVPVPLRRYTQDAEAYQLYANGRFHRLRGTEAGLRLALADFEQAISRDPGFAVAYVGVAEVYTIFGVFGIVAPHDTFPQAQQAVAKALELAPDLGEAYASLGHIKMQYEHDWLGAEQAFRRAIELNPSYAPAHQWFGIYLGNRGKFDEALEQVRTAQELEPSSPTFSAVFGMILNYERRYDEAITQLTTTLEMDAALPAANTYLVASYVRSGRYDEAMKRLTSLTGPAPGSTGYAGQIYAFSGRHAEALAEVERLIALRQQRYVPAYEIATIWAALGEADQTFAWLERAFEERSTLIAWLPWDEVFDGIRADPRYAPMVKRLSVSAGR